MKKLDTAVFGIIPQPTTFGELIDLIRQPVPSENRLVRMWRGQSNISWPIHSTAYRRIAIDKTPSDRKMVHYELGLLKRSTHSGYRYVNGMQLSDFDLLAKLQHHGCATRLVDATRNALVGLYFASATRPDEFGALIGLHAHFLGGYEGESIEDKYEEVVEDLPQYNYPQTWQPSDVSPRIAAQHSQFLFSSVSPSKTGSLYLDDTPEAVLVIAITPKLKRESVKILSEVFDIRAQTLFPDIDGFGIANGFEVPTEDSYRW